MFHYLSCGVPNVFLKNGFSVRNTSHGKATAIESLENLHRAIGLCLTGMHRHLATGEFRFLRVETDLSQLTVAQRFGVSEPTVRNWEAGRSPIPFTADVCMRVLYLEFFGESTNVTAMFHSVDHEAVAGSPLIFQYSDRRWCLE